MSRQSRDEIIDGKLKNGYDYGLQCWVLDYHIQNCGHLYDYSCNCIGRIFEGRDITEVRNSLKSASK